MLKDVNLWKAQKNLDSNLRAELDKLDEKGLFEAFGEDVTFGTGGIRGIMGVGTNRLNIYTIRKATLGFAQYLKNNYALKPNARHNAVIAYDTRFNSRLFAEEAARVLASQGIHVWLFEEYRPTPELSFAVRYLKAEGGIIITASHNPPEYNGYKVYDENGCQLTPLKADKVGEAINNCGDVFNLKLDSIEQYVKFGMVVMLGKYFDEKYLTGVKFVSCQKVDKTNFKIVYSPLHGTGSAFGMRLLSESGYDVTPVATQMLPDSSFSSVKSPNPEDPLAFELAVKLGKEIGADLLLATDPDADRVGAGVLVDGEYRFLNGNEMAAIIFDYLLKYGNRVGQHVFISTIVTSDLVFEMAKRNGIESIRTLTGFKFICEQIERIKKERKDFFFGCEESYGYLVSDFVRDKDAFQACLIIAEVTAFHHSEGRHLFDVLDDIHREYGHYQEKLLNIKSPGINGVKNINRFMEEMRKSKIKKIGDNKIISTEDYLLGVAVDAQGHKSKIDLPSSDVLKYIFEGGWVVFRPSGTEPKLKVYISLKDHDQKALASRVKKMTDFVNELLKEKGVA
ncbi:MAG: phospho-sugar mutase [Bacilli bacterium]